MKDHNEVSCWNIATMTLLYSVLTAEYQRHQTSLLNNYDNCPIRWVKARNYRLINQTFRENPMDAVFVDYSLYDLV